MKVGYKYAAHESLGLVREQILRPEEDIFRNSVVKIPKGEFETKTRTGMIKTGIDKNKRTNPLPKKQRKLIHHSRRDMQEAAKKPGEIKIINKRAPVPAFSLTTIN